MSCSVVPVPSRLVTDVWQQVRPLIDKGLAKDDRYQSEDILVSLLKQDRQLWLIERDREMIAAIVTEIINYPRVRECTVFMLAGKDAKQWLDRALTVIGHWAYQNGCKRGRMFGRLGWERTLNDKWKRQQLVMTTELQGGT